MFKKNDQMFQLDSQAYNEEQELHDLLAHNPEILFSDYPDLKNLQLLLVKCEAPIYENEEATAPTRLDILFLGSDCILNFIEVKLSSNPEIRRKIVGQGLEYAANAVVNWKIEDVQEMFRQTCRKESLDPETTFRDFLGPNNNANEFWDAVNVNLRAGKIRIIFASDSIPTSLKNIVQFLRNQMKPAVILAIDVPQFISEDHQVIVPKLYGQSQVGVGGGSGREDRWTEAEFLAELAKNTTPDDAATAKKIKDWADENGIKHDFGSGGELGSLFLEYMRNKRALVSLTLNTDGNIRVDFRWMRTYPPFTDQLKRIELVKKLNEINGVQLSENLTEGYPTFPIRLLREERSFIQFTQIVLWVMQEYRAADLTQ